jgi:hypothetical protein
MAPKGLGFSFFDQDFPRNIQMGVDHVREELKILIVTS